ncbi:unnamed protein product [Oikopleura dioica]|uniref:Conserved oligomeric Golgi complex subunit 5 n=1 Tax=Oikopleura dioica TaxID=34765 RepID=E4X6P7_OIKDI|nr:unnamed protein product [Oikopleura dioica]
MANANEVVERLTEQDPHLAQFLEDDFKTEQYAMQVLKSSVVSNVLVNLQNSVNLLNNELQNQISARHEDLLAQTTGIESLESVLDVMTSRISSLKDVVGRISARISEPFAKMEARTLQLSRLQDATDLLRRLIRLLYLTKRLRTQISQGMKEVTKAAQTLNELDFLQQDNDVLSKISIIQEDLEFISKSKKDVEVEAHRLLEKGISGENPSQVATSLQVFFNLGQLSSAVNRQVEDCKTNAEKSIQEAVDVRLLTDNSSSQGTRPGRANMSISSQVNLKANLWASLDEMVEYLHVMIINVQQIQKVILKKRDPVTHLLFSELMANEGCQTNLSLAFWRNLVSHIQKALKKSAQYNVVIKTTFEQEYPRLLRILLSLWDKVQQNKEGFGLMFGSMETDYNPEQDLRNSIASFKSAHVSNSLNTLLTHVNSSFQPHISNNKTVVVVDVDSISKEINSELSTILFDDELQNDAIKNIEQAVNLYIAKVEGLIARTPNSSQVIGPMNDTQVQNYGLVNSTYMLSEYLDEIQADQRESLTETAKIGFTSMIDSCEQLMKTIMEPIFASVADAIESIILTMHKEDFSMDENTMINKPSLFIRELEPFIKRVVKEHFSFIQARAFIAQNLSPLAARALKLFIRHITLVRPIGQGGKEKIFLDFKFFEDSLSPLCSRLCDLDRVYQTFRAVRPLISATEQEIMASGCIGESVPHSTCITLVMSRADQELKSPFEVADWSRSRYSQWLDDHESEKERLSLLKGTVENYTKNATLENKVQFVPEISTITELLQQGLSI